jgi:tetratricopeptide (TPR) repeat protein
MFVYAARLYRAGWQAADAVWVHDDWMQLLAEYGFVGFAVVRLAFVVCLAWGLDGFFRPLRLRSGSGDRPFSNSAAMALGAWCCLVAFGVHSLLDFNLHLSANALLAAAVLGILASPQMAEARWPGVRWLSRGVAALALAGAVAGMGMFLWRAAPADYRLLRATNALARGEVDAALAETEAGLAAAPEHAALLAARARGFAEYESAKQLEAVANEPDVDEQELVIDEPEAATGAVAAEEAAGFELSEAERRRCQESAAEYFAKAVAGRPMEREYRVLLGSALDELGRKPEARAQFLEAVRLDPAHGFAWGALGDHYYHTDQLVKALEIYTFASWMPGGNYPAIRAGIVRDELAPESDEDAEAGE